MNKKAVGYIDDLIIDVRITEEHVFTNEITSLPVEDSIDITDNIKNKPLQLSINGFITNSPIKESSEKTGDNYVANAYDKIMRIYKNRELVEIQTTLELYTNMAVVNCTLPQDNNTGDSLYFTMQLQQVNIVENEFTTVKNKSVNINGKAENIDKRNANKKNNGSQKTKKVDKKKSSLLFKIFGGK